MAQTTTSATYCCLKTEQTLEEIVNGVHPGLLELEQWGVSDAIQDSEQGIIEKVATASPFGKGAPTTSGNRTVDVKYWKPSCDDTNVDITFDCSDESVTAETYGYDRATIDYYVGDKFAIDASTYETVCEDPLNELAVKMARSYRKLKKLYNKRLAEQLAAKVGNYFAHDGETAVNSATNPQTLKVLTAGAPVQPQPMGFFPVVNQYDRMGVMGRTLYGVGGSDKMRAYQFAKPIFAGNTDGADANRKMDPVDLYFDNMMESYLDTQAVAGTDRFITWVAGAVSVLEWFDFEGPIKTITPSGRNVFAPAQASGTLVRQKIDLGTAMGDRPFVVDMQIEYRECDNKVVHKFRKDFDLWQIPDDAFQTACHQAHNYLLLWQIGCGDFDCNDANYPKG